MDKHKKSTLEELMNNKEHEEVLEDDKHDAITLDEPKKKIWLVLLLSALAVVLLAGGGYVAWQSYVADKELKEDEKIQNPIVEEREEKTEETTELKESAVYVTAAEGLNLRKEPKSDAEVLAIIPIGTKLVILETSGDWHKVEYESKMGWVAKLYTSDTNPLVYKNTEHGFGLTFPITWGSYTVVKRDDSGEGVTAYYDVFLATSETGIAYTDGKASMFVIGVYTPSQWSVISETEGPKPGIIKETSKYVYTYSPSQASPEDLMDLRSDVNDIIKTFVEL